MQLNKLPVSFSLLILFTGFGLAQSNYEWRWDPNGNYTRGSAEDSDQQKGLYHGELSSNPYRSDSTSNSYGTYGSRYSSESINNPYSSVGQKAQNEYGYDGPKLYSNDGKYLGRVNKNKYDPESISNPYGRYGSKYSPDSVNNPYGRYGSKYSSESTNNPYATSAPKLWDDE